jgi:hypothetical protein
MSTAPDQEATPNLSQTSHSMEIIRSKDINSKEIIICIYKNNIHKVFTLIPHKFAEQGHFPPFVFATAVGHSTCFFPQRAPLVCRADKLHPSGA